MPIDWPPFAVRQVSRAFSKRGTIRGLHFTDVPPGQGKYVTCISGRALDIVVDIRVGSPTFGEHMAFNLIADEGHCLYIAAGMAHGYAALENGTGMLYLHDAEYAPQFDRDLQALDKTLLIKWPVGFSSPIRSLKDIAAPTLQEALLGGVLPAYADCSRSEK